MSVTDMLIAILNCCTKEELEEEDETPMITPESPEIEQGKLLITPYNQRTSADVTVEEEDNPERRQVIKNKILAVGRMSRVFSLLR
jgi:serine/threonine-protein phosphatase 2B catalytic subunit